MSIGADDARFRIAGATGWAALGRDLVATRPRRVDYGPAPIYRTVE